MELELVANAQKTLKALYAQVPEQVAKDVEAAVNAAFAEIVGLTGQTTPQVPRNEAGDVTFRSIEDAIKLYVDIRDINKIAQGAANKRDEKAKEDMALISMWLRDKGDEFGVDSFKTPSGTAYRSVKTSYRMGDWTSFIDWVDRTKNYQCLEKRVAKLATKEIHDHMAQELANIEQIADEKERAAALIRFRTDTGIDPHMGGVPPGVTYMTEVEFDVRRPSKRGEKDE